MSQPEEVFLVTHINPKPDFYHPAKSVKIMSEKAMKMKIQSWPDTHTFIVLRAQITQWEDVTDKYVRAVRED